MQRGASSIQRVPVLNKRRPRVKLGSAIFSLHSRVKASRENIRGSPVELILLAKAGYCEGERGNGRTEKVVLSQDIWHQTRRRSQHLPSQLSTFLNQSQRSHSPYL